MGTVNPVQEPGHQLGDQLGWVLLSGSVFDHLRVAPFCDFGVTRVDEIAAFKALDELPGQRCWTIEADRV
ncbi:MAG: hypothetical protein LBE08_00425 [Bifidobacteriaceae bacterium]|jgi:hypothetical protein|nr:hypothetical protein [Bifidobacteriaceae bacterium]